MLGTAEAMEVAGVVQMTGAVGAAPTGWVEPSGSCSSDSSITTSGADGANWVEGLAEGPGAATSLTLASPLGTAGLEPLASLSATMLPLGLGLRRTSGMEMQS